MTSSLLSTKIILPPLQTGHVYRQRLLPTVALHPDIRLVLVSAPAGFGKTSCLLEWCHSLKSNGTQVVWYALDVLDNDPVRFASHLSEAFQKGVDGVSHAVFDNSPTGNLGDTVREIVNELSKSPQYYVIVLDDYHLITAPELHAALSLMLEHLPRNVQIAIGSRADPPLQLSRLRARGQIVELRAAQLRFSPQELASLFQQALGVTLSQAHIEQLDQMSEGWAAALRLMTLALDSVGRVVDDAAIERLLSRYSTTQQHIFDYFADEVFEQQSEEIRQFLLDTCVLNRLTPNVCGTLTSNCGAPRLLEQLAHSRLFVIPLSETAPIYRYYHLFEDFLRQRLHLENPERHRDRHRTAAEWYEQQDDMIEAVHHALMAEDYPYAAWLIEERAWETLTSRGEIMTIMNWMPYFRDEVLKRRPRLCLYFSRALYLTGDAKRSQDYVQLATSVLDDDKNEIKDRQALRAIAFNYQATLAAYRGDIESGLHWIDQASALSHTVAGLDRVRIANTDGFLRYLKGDVPEARRAYEYALELAYQLDHDYLMLDAHYYLEQIDLLTGTLQAVQDRCDKLLAKYPSKIGPLSAVMVPLAYVHYQRNHVVEAEVVLRDAIELARRAHIPDVLWFAHISLADVLLTRGATAEAEASIAQAHSYAQGFRSPMMGVFIGAAQARIMLRSGQLQTAVDWAVKYQQMEKADYHQDYENITLARIELVQGDYTSVLSLLAAVISGALAAGRSSYVMTAEMLRALAYHASGDLTAALISIERALTLAQPHGFVRLFLDMEQPMLRLLHHALESDICSDYIEYLLAIAAHNDRVQHPADTLTEREIEVLRHITNGASNQDIANALVISLGTVKSHIHHIMNKLDAQNRTEAVNKARSLNILPD